MISRRDFLKLGGAALLSASFPALRLPAAGPTAPLVVYHGSRKYPKIAMTFDDCWHPQVLEQLMAIAEPFPGFHFTFFAIGDAIEIDEAMRPGIWKRLYQAGHEIGYHTYQHVDPQVMSKQSLLNDYARWYSTLSQAVGTDLPVHFARPPYDDLSLSWQEFCLEQGLVATLYSTGFEASTMPESMRLASQAVNGDIVQMHTYQDPPHARFDLDITATAVPYLARQGFTLITMTQLYDDLLIEQNNSDGCDIGRGNSPTRTCLD
ncbi:MAG TPA: polysaccharide deacetylase family protein [Anaerolineales bacterium]|nr:polysaccharide deacetylase family protein [Anaerolineales bacterium]